MKMIQVQNIEASAWNHLIGSLPGSHLLQTWEWSQVKTRYGWQPMPLIWQEDGIDQGIAAAMVLKRPLPVSGFSKKMCLLYIPKGPLLDWSNEALRLRVLEDLQGFAARQGAIFIKMDPDVIVGTGVPGSPDAREVALGLSVSSNLQQCGWSVSQDQIQFKNTVLVDLNDTEDALLARMKQKTRYNIRLAEKKGVTVRTGGLSDLPTLYRLYAETSVRDGFVIRDEKYYQVVWSTFIQAATADGKSLTPFAQPLIAEVDGQPVAAIFIFYFADRAYYLYGMSTQAHREKMPNHLLQWEAMRQAKAQGCFCYDLWGAPDTFNENDSMWGVFRFKQGLGGMVTRTLGAWDYTPSPLLYRLYTRVIPRLLDGMRSRGQARTRQAMA